MSIMKIILSLCLHAQSEWETIDGAIQKVFYTDLRVLEELGGLLYWLLFTAHCSYCGFFDLRVKNFHKAQTTSAGGAKIGTKTTKTQIRKSMMPW
jgi:hypothetical protein